MEAVSLVLKVVQLIVKAAKEARRNRASCRDLAHRARTIGRFLPLHDPSSTSTKAGCGGDTAGSALGRLKAALDDAHRLVESCRRRSCWLSLLTGYWTATRFQAIHKKIDSCVVDLGLEKLCNDDRRRRDANTRGAGSGVKEANRGNNNGKKKDAVTNDGAADMNRDKRKKKYVAAKDGDNGKKKDAAAKDGGSGKKKDAVAKDGDNGKKKDVVVLGEGGEPGRQQREEERRRCQGRRQREEERRRCQGRRQREEERRRHQ